MRVIYPVVALLLMIAAVSFVLPTSQVVVFDSQRVQAQFIRQLAERNVGDTEVKTRTQRFSVLLKKALDHHGHRSVILDKKTVLAGGRDITPEIINELSEMMRTSS